MFRHHAPICWVHHRPAVVRKPHEENNPMSDPQQSAPPSYYATTRLPETDIPPPPPAKRGRGWLYAAIGAVLVIAIGVGFFFVLGRTLFQAQRTIPRLVG